MSLGIVFKGPEGIVLAAASRVTLTGQAQSDESNQPVQIFQASFDNATKLLKVNGQDFVGVVTYGAGALGTQEPRTAHSLLPEFEKKLTDEDVGRLPVKEFAERLSKFFMDQWKDRMPEDYPGSNMVFLN